MKNVSNPCVVEEGSWQDFRDAVKKVNPTLFDLIEKIDPDKSFKLLRATYLYGEKITDFGMLCLPDKDGQLHRLNEPEAPKHYRELLDYAATPLMLQLQNGGEAFMDTRERVVPLNIFLPGDLFGVFEAIAAMTGCTNAPSSSITSGARSVFLAPKITDSIGHKRLRKEYGVAPRPPKTLQEQWSVIKTIGNNARQENPWTSQVLIFTKKWFQKREDDLAWVLFHQHLLIKGWEQAQYWRTRRELSIYWEAFAVTLRKRNLKPGPYLLSSITHLVLLAQGVVPGFKVADDNELLLPSRIIEYAYEKVYHLKDYAPVVLHPWRWNKSDNHSSLYYSLSYPTLIEGTPAIRHSQPGIIAELREIKMLLQTFLTTLKTHPVNTPKPLKNIEFEYFHCEKDHFKEIEDSVDLIKKDENILQQMQRFPEKKFPYLGPFFRGCVRVGGLD